MPRAKKEAVSSETVDYTPVVDAQEEPKVAIVAEPTNESAKGESKSAEEGIAELNRKLKEADERLIKVERERNEAIQRAYAANNEKEDTNLRLIESAIGQVTENSRSLKRDLSSAYAAGDFDRVADIQEAIARNEAQKLQLENGKQSLKERPKEPPRPLDPVEAFASQLSPRSAAWVRSHPEYATNPNLTAKMIAAHNLAVADGLVADTDDYFESVEDTLKIGRRTPVRAPAMDDDWRGEQFSDAAPSRGGRQVSPAAIPVSRDMSPSGQKIRSVRLTAAEVEIAAATGLTPEEYASQKARIERERRESMN